MTRPTEQDRAEYSQGVCMDGAAILRDGAMMTVDDIVGTLNALQARVAELEKERDGLEKRVAIRGDFVRSLEAAKQQSSKSRASATSWRRSV